MTLYPELELTFKHALTHEVTYGGLLQERRRTLHAQIVDAIERLYPDRLDEHVERLAHHALRGEAWGKAVAYADAARGKALARLAYGEETVSARAQRARDFRTPVDPELAIDLRMGIGPFFQSAGANRPLLEQYVIAETIARAIQDDARLSKIHALMIAALSGLGEYDRAIEVGQRAPGGPGDRRHVARDVHQVPPCPGLSPPWPATAGGG